MSGTEIVEQHAHAHSTIGRPDETFEQSLAGKVLITIAK